MPSSKGFRCNRSEDEVTMEYVESLLNRRLTHGHEPSRRAKISNQRLLVTALVGPMM